MYRKVQHAMILYCKRKLRCSHIVCDCDLELEVTHTQVTIDCTAPHTSTHLAPQPFKFQHARLQGSPNNNTILAEAAGTVAAPCKTVACS
jgi:hypothetical protein